jgi:uncharacterized protein (DUF433 family)
MEIIMLTGNRKKRLANAETRQRRDPKIVRVEGICGGKPTLEGHRLEAFQLWINIHYGGTTQEIADEYDLSVAQVEKAVHYIEDHPEWIPPSLRPLTYPSEIG